MPNSFKALLSSTKPLTVVVVIFVGLLFFQIGYRIMWFNTELETFEQTLIEEAKFRLSIEITNRIEEFDYMIQRVDDDYFDRMENDLFAMESSYQLLMDHSHLSGDDLEEAFYDAILDASQVDVVEFYDQTYQKFNWQGTDLIKTSLDTSDAFFGLETPSICAVEHTTPITYNDMDYLVLCRVIDNYIILLGADYATLVDEERTRIVERFQSYYADSEDYMFILGTNGDIHLHAFEDYMGQNMYDIGDVLFIDTAEIIINALEEDTQAFLTYEFYASPERDVSSERIAFVILYEPFDILIGRSVPADTFVPLIEAYRSDMITNTFIVHLPITLLLIILLFVGAYFLMNYTQNMMKIILEEEDLYKKIAESSNQLIVITDSKGHILYLNEKAKTTIGRRTSDYETPLWDYIQKEDDQLMLISYDKAYIIRLRDEPIQYHRKPATLYFIEDVTHAVEKENQLLHQVDRDALTNLYNRRKLQKDFATWLKDHITQGGEGAFVIIDFDNFKSINTMYGHEYGDRVLTEISALFQAYQTDIIRFYRLGGDEFGVLARCSNRQLNHILQTLKKDLSQKLFKGIKLDFTYGSASIHARDDKKRFDDYYAEADQRMYKFKNKG